MIEVVRLSALEEPLRSQLEGLLERSGLGTVDLEATEFYGHLGSRGSLLGVVGFQETPSGALLRSLAVEPAHRGKGIGSALVGHVLALLAARCSRVFLYTEDGVGYFRRFGFEVTSPSSVPEEIRALPLVRDRCASRATPMVLTLESEAP